jgi:hypothetical protein
MAAGIMTVNSRGATRSASSLVGRHLAVVTLDTIDGAVLACG